MSMKNIFGKIKSVQSFFQNKDSEEKSIAAHYTIFAVVSFVKRNIIILYVSIFLTILSVGGACFYSYYSAKKAEILTLQYIAAQSKIADMDKKSALELFQNVYNKSNGVLALLSAKEISQILASDGQYDNIFKIFEDADKNKKLTKNEKFMLMTSYFNAISTNQEHFSYSIYNEKLQYILSQIKDINLDDVGLNVYKMLLICEISAATYGTEAEQYKHSVESLHEYFLKNRDKISDREKSVIMDLYSTIQ
jgi:hypothetical protein